jgi:hypothetical protein
MATNTNFPGQPDDPQECYPTPALEHLVATDEDQTTLQTMQETEVITFDLPLVLNALIASIGLDRFRPRIIELSYCWLRKKSFTGSVRCLLKRM